jgi:capsular polysaccharide transport system permease protein
MPTILVRHVVMYSINAIKINRALLYHRKLTILDLFLSRIAIEIVGVSLAFFLIFVALLFFGLAPFPKDLGLVYEGWVIVSIVASGMALMLGSISEVVDVVERIIGITLYLLVPLSGTFFLADWLPPDVRKFALLLPFLNCAEMIRSGVFGSTIVAHYDAGYTLSCGIVMNFIGLLLVRQVRDRVEIE